ncbi:hypothetical protein LCGC14_2934490 [marine sediment metagenome]|uniref:Uncharacterized protein n=1 Tax=marine sediment metagenome TaxID=412755 RepID=A0A0F8ZSL7_9ZZZZ
MGLILDSKSPHVGVEHRRESVVITLAYERMPDDEPDHIELETSDVPALIEMLKEVMDRELYRELDEHRP